MRYVKKHNCVSRIIQDNLTEDQAYILEEKTIKQYKKTGECFLNFDEGGRRGGRSPGKLNGMWGKTHSPEAVRKIKEANLGHTGEANSNARLCQILSLDYVVLFEFRTVIDLTKKYIQLHQEEFN